MHSVAGYGLGAFFWVRSKFWDIGIRHFIFMIPFFVVDLDAFAG